MTHWERIHGDVRYPIGGSFMKRLIDTYGIQRVSDFFRRSKTAHWKTAFQEAFGVPIGDFEALWLRKL